MSDGAAKLRIDKWLWQARFFKTRSLAAKIVSGGVRVNTLKVAKPAYGVAPGDVLTFAQGRQVRQLLEMCFVNPPPRDTYPIFGRPGVIRRDAIWFGRYNDGFFPLYRTHKNAYGKPTTKFGVTDALPTVPMPKWLVRVLDELSERHNLPQLNHAVIHRYVDGDDTIGQHHDKPMDLHPRSTIVSVSIGATRAFRLGADTFDVQDGDTIMIPYSTNLALKHGVPKRKRCDGVRYSITARTVRTFTDCRTHRVDDTIVNA